jgi:predicted ATPase/DNA-binding CsgD family transcriptional regulator
MAGRTRFVGRESEVARLRTHVEAARLVTLTGPGGIGKTRLALELVDRLGPDRRSVLVELASVRDDRQILQAVAAALGIRDAGGVSLPAAVSEAIASTPTRLVLDNLEHLRGAATVVADLLAASPTLRVVATSRIALGLSDELEVVVPPLDLPEEGSTDPVRIAGTEAVAMFVDRAHAVRPGLVVDENNAPVIAEICRRLDGLPLAIELAAARLKVLSPVALRNRLDQRLALLTRGPTDAPARQRTLRATIAWSYELLDEQAQAAFRRCGIFVAAFGIDAAAAAVHRDPTDMLDVLSGLVDHSLLGIGRGRDDEPRFAMLETLREFAMESMTTEEVEPARRRYAAYAIELAETAAMGLRGPEHDLWLGRLVDDLDNLRGILDWASAADEPVALARLAAALTPYWRYYGDLREGLRWTAAALARRADLPPAVAARVLRAAGWLEAVSGRLDAGDGLLREALAIFEDLGDGREMAATLYQLGSTARDRGRGDEARGYLERGLERARAADDPSIEARVLLALGWVAIDAGRPAERARHVEAAAAAAIRSGDRQRLGLIVGEQGWVAWTAGDIPTAVARWAESADIVRGLGEQAFLATCLLILGSGEIQIGDLRAARDHTLEGLDLSRKVGSLPDVVVALVHAASLVAAAGAPDRAAVHLAAARAIRRANGLDESPDYIRRLEREVAEAVPDVPAAPVDGTIEGAVEAAIADVESVDVDIPARGVDGGRVGRRRRPDDLTAREREVLALVVDGRSNAQIGEALFISRKTASVHVANIKDKLGAESRVEVVTIALRDGLTEDRPTRSEIRGGAASGRP